MLNSQIRLSHQQASESQLVVHLMACDSSFVPRLSSRTDIEQYSAKLFTRAQRFEAWAAEELVALVAAYCNCREHGVAFVTSVSVLPEWQGQGLASSLLQQCWDYAARLGFGELRLEVSERNSAAVRLYERLGFSRIETRDETLVLSLAISSRNGA